MNDHKIEYDEELHQYKIDGKVVPSVTQLAKEFSGMNTDWLESHPQYAQKGTLIHNELSEYYNKEDVELKFDESKSIVSQLDKDPTFQTEVLLYNATLGYAGTADLVSIKDGKCKLLVDFKSGTTVERKYFLCQLNLYRLALEDMGIDTSEIKMYIINPEKSIKQKEVSFDQMKALTKGDIEPEKDIASKIAECETIMAECEDAVNAYNNAKEKIKELLLQTFKEKDGTTYTTSEWAYTFAPSSVRRTLDTEKVKEKLGEELDSCFRETTISETIRFKRI